jgi:hypothetical protein
MSTIRFDIPADVEQALREQHADLDRYAKEVYLMEQYRRGLLTHRQLEAALGLGFTEVEHLLKLRGLGQDLDDEAFGDDYQRLRSSRPR